MVKLPGPRGVLGYEVSAKGQVFRSRHRLTGRYLSQTPVAKEVLHQDQNMKLSVFTTRPAIYSPLLNFTCEL
ncbi:hypothetical protein HaLaN_13367, partial [Haematococcus lacustris]